MKNLHYFQYLLILLLSMSCSKSKEKLVKPIVQNINETVFASGVLEADERYNLTAQADGYLVGILFNEGDVVKTNQVLGKIDNKTNNANVKSSSELLKIAELNTTDESPALKQLQVNSTFAEEKLQQEMVQLNRYKKLFESNAVSKMEVENYQLAVNNAQSNVNSIKQQIQNLKLQAEQVKITQNASNSISIANQDFNTIRTLLSGKIIKRFKQTGDFVKKGDIIATIANQNSIIAKLNVDENSIDKIKIGQKVTIQLNVQKNTLYEGILSEIVPLFDEATQSFICKVHFTKELTFKISGTQLEANIEVGKKEKALLIPRSSMGFGNKVKIKGKDDLVVIKTGIISTEWVEVLEGLTINDELESLKP